MRRAYYSQKESPVDSFASMSRASLSEAESEISSRSHKPAPDCRNSEWDYGRPQSSRNRITAQWAPKFDRSDFETCERTTSRVSHNWRMGLNTGESHGEGERERGREMGFPMDGKDFAAFSFHGWFVHDLKRTRRNFVSLQRLRRRLGKRGNLHAHSPHAVAQGAFLQSHDTHEDFAIGTRFRCLVLRDIVKASREKYRDAAIVETRGASDNLKYTQIGAPR